VPAPRVLALLLVLALALPPAGCVERKFLIRSEPEGASVRVNGLFVGRTPVEIPFNDYGVVLLEADPMDADRDSAPEFQGFSGPFDLAAPWYQWFPLDFFSDNLWPWTVVDRHGALLVLKPALDYDSKEDELRMKEMIPGLRVRAERERTEQEAAPPERPK
jgi:hypothetical protein